jgi:hypothetical protein
MPVSLLIALVSPLAGGQHGTEHQNKKEIDRKAAEPVASEDNTPAEKAARKTAQARQAARAVVLQFIDDSSMKLTLRDEHIELTTPYGKLVIPVRDIERIEFATRIPDAVAKRIESAITDLGQTDFQRREAASAELLELGERAYLALLKAEKSTDREVVRRVRDLLETVRAEVPEEYLEFRPHDVIYTADSKFTGRLSAVALKVQTLPFGEQQINLADVRCLRLPSPAKAELANVLHDPGNLTMMQGQVGQIHAFRVTGMGQGGQPVGAGGGLWGTDTYTLDSNLALAAVHAGVLKPGQTGVVRVKILGQQAIFQGSTRHGVTSMAFGVYNGSFQFVRGRAREAH